MNERMRTSLGQATPPELAEAERLSEKISELLSEGFTDLDGAVVFTAMRNTAERVSPDNFPDVTGYECFVNHIHVEDYIDGSLSDQVAVLRQAIAFALATENQLHSLFPGKPFKVIVVSNPSGCGVRFHSMRSGEEWLASDLEEYTEEAILVRET